MDGIIGETSAPVVVVPIEPLPVYNLKRVIKHKFYLKKIRSYCEH